jgi:hypothetical protein
MPAIQTLEAARNIDFAPTIWLDYAGDPLPIDEYAICTMQVRQYQGAAGAAEVEDLAVTITDAAHDTDAGWRTLTIEPNILRGALEDMPGQNQPDPGDAQVFVYEIMLTYSDGAQDSLMLGDFILSAGVDTTSGSS